MPNRQLRHADRVRQVYIKQLVPRLGDRVRRLARARRDLEVAKSFLEYASARAHDVDGAEGALGRVEGVLELCPGCHVAFFEDGSSVSTGGAGRGGGVDEVLGFGPEGQVGDEDVAVFGDEYFGEAEVYSFGGFHFVLVLKGRGAELRGGRLDIALPVLAGVHRAATLTPVRCRRGEPS